MKASEINERRRVLDPENTEPVLLDRWDRHLIEEALLWYAEEQEHREEWQRYCEHLAYVVTDF